MNSGTRMELERGDLLAWLRLVPGPGRPPLLEGEALGELEVAVADLEAEPPRLLVVESASEKYFCLGADITVLREVTEDSLSEWIGKGHRVLNRMEALPCPVVARVEGYAMGGGLEIALACDLIYASETAIFAQSEAALGFVPGWGGTLRLAERIGDAAAKRLFFTGRHVDAATALGMGLVDYVGSAEALEAELEMLARAINGNSAAALAAFKGMLTGERREARARAEVLERETSLRCLRDGDTRERLERFLNRKTRSGAQS